MAEPNPTTSETTVEPNSTSTSAMTTTNEQSDTNTPQDQQQNQQDSSRLTELTAAANLQYSLKNYTAAADLFSSATELQASLRGEMAPENAELLYAYGRCLYQVAVSRSDVLGGKVGEEAAGSAGKEAAKRGKKRGRDGDDVVTAGSETAKGKERKVEVGEEQMGKNKAAGGSNTALDALPEVPGQPMFQFKGDENFTASDDEDEDEDDGDDADGDDGEGGGGDVDADEDDFANAYEILDLARILVARQRDELVALSKNATTDENATKSAQMPPQPGGQGLAKSNETTKPPLRHLSERLADIYDLQAEISLENERFTDAVVDCRAALQLKKELYPPQSNLVAEAHFKLSLALEFASVTTSSTSEGQDGEAVAGSSNDSGDKKDKQQQQQQQQVDSKMREEAAQEMAAAIESCKLRIAEEEKVIATKSEDTADGQAVKERKKKEIADVTEMIEDMEQRLQDLRAPLLPQTTSASLLNSLLGSSGGTKAQGQSRTGASNATDLTSLVRRKDKDADKSKDVPGKHASGGDSSQPMAGTNVKEEANGTKEQAGKDDGVEKKRGKRGLLLDGEDAGGNGVGVSGDEGVMSASEGVAEGVKRVRVD